MNASFEKPFAVDSAGALLRFGVTSNSREHVIEQFDEQAADNVLESFRQAADDEKFPGILVDFEHASLDPDQPSAAAGWVSSMSVTPDGLLLGIDWTDLGAQALQGGRYRFVSPVFDSELIGDGTYRPTALESLALTN